MQAVKCFACGMAYSLDYVALGRRHTIALEWMQKHCLEKHNINLVDKRAEELMAGAMNDKNRVVN